MEDKSWNLAEPHKMRLLALAFRPAAAATAAGAGAKAGAAEVTAARR